MDDMIVTFRVGDDEGLETGILRLSEFIASNEFTAEEEAELRQRLEAGEIVKGGGGAMPVWEVEQPIDELADSFAELLREQLSPADFAEMKRRNEKDPAYAGSSCASHDFCDANEVMAEAWEEVVGPPINSDDEAETRLWAAAWERARQRHIGTQVDVAAAKKRAAAARESRAGVTTVDFVLSQVDGTTHPLEAAKAHLRLIKS